jgi:hypothetical protein
MEEDRILQIAKNQIDYYLHDPLSQIEGYPELIYSKDLEAKKEPNGSVIKMSKKKNIDQFFNDGSLQLGSFAFYHKIENPESQDKMEGNFILVGQNDSQTSFSKVQVGKNALIFCCTDGHIDEELKSDFDYDSHFLIDDPEGFIQAVSKNVGSSYSRRSQCVYSRNRIFVADVQGKIQPMKLPRIGKVGGSTKYFMKGAKFHHQKEYRFLWEFDSPVPERLIIKCPEAIQYCSRPVE